MTVRQGEIDRVLEIDGKKETIQLSDILKLNCVILFLFFELPILTLPVKRT
jgi:hypothetical protein